MRIHEIDLLDPGAYQEGQPWAWLRWLQENEPVSRHEEKDGPASYEAGEGNAMFKALLERIPDLEPNGPTAWNRADAPIAPSVVGPKAMPVRFTPGPRSRRSG